MKKVNKKRKRRQSTNKHDDYSDTDKSYESNCISDEDSNTYPSLPFSDEKHIEYGKIITFFSKNSFNLQRLIFFIFTDNCSSTKSQDKNIINSKCF